jgi:hypothetical protein
MSYIYYFLIINLYLNFYIYLQAFFRAMIPILIHYHFHILLIIHNVDSAFLVIYRIY